MADALVTAGMVDLDPRPRAGPTGRTDVGGPGPVLEETEPPPGGLVTQRRGGSGVEERRSQLTLDREAGVAQGVDAWVNAMQPSTPQPPRHLPLGQSGLEQLGS